MNNQIRKSTYIYNLFFGITSLCTVISSNNLVSAQIVPDNTLPNNSEVKVEGNINKIEGGTTNGGNLFHSFEKFGVPIGSEAHFNNTVDISNIITRVTGNSISDIDGLIKANGSANLFLINPNGIVFGNNARLDIGGSFVGSTADSIKFGDDVEFSAKNPQQTPLLTMNVPMGLQYGSNPGQIQVKGDGEGIRKSSEIPDTQTGLRVKPDKTLALVGGDINLEGATLKTSGGRIELGSVKKDLVNIIPAEKGFSLNYDAVENGGNIDLSRQAAVDASGEGAGDIQVWGRNIKITDYSQIETSTLGSENGGDLVVNAQDSVEIIGASASIFPSILSASVYPEATGNGGDLTINTQNLLLIGGGVSTNTFGKGNSGKLNLNAKKIELIGTNNQDNTSDIVLSRGGLSTSSQPIEIGDEGQITINPNRSLGDAGELTINTDSLIVKDGAQISTSTYGNGKGGNLNVNASDIQLIGTAQVNGVPIYSGLFSSSEIAVIEDGKGVTFDSDILLGDAGNLNINANSLSVKDGAQVNTSTFGRGNGGSLKIVTDKLLVENGGLVFSSTFGEGKGGNLTVNAREIELIGRGGNDIVSDNLLFNTALLSSSQPIIDVENSGDAGNLNINTDTLLVKDRALVSTETFGKGEGGDLTINARDIQLIGSNPVNGSVGGLTASAGGEGIGNAGNLTINTDSLLVKDGAQVGTNTTGEGKSGSLTVNARDIQLTGTTPDAQFPSGLFATAESYPIINSEGKLTFNADSDGLLGDAGNLKINTDTLSVKDGAVIAVYSLGAGIAGNIDINADSVKLDEGLVLAVTLSTNGGNINLDIANLLLMRSSSKITSNAGLRSATGDGGNININIPNGFIVATPNQNNDITANAFAGKGGRVKINAAGIFGMKPLNRKELERLLSNDLDPFQLPTNDITAFSRQNPDLSGFIEIITPETSPNNGLIELPTVPVETEVTDACSTKGYANSSFTITGKGSLPPSPFKPLTGRLNRTKLATLDEVDETKLQQRQSRIKKQPEIKQIVEARGWVRTKDGKIILVANPVQNTSFQARKNTSCSYQSSMNN